MIAHTVQEPAVTDDPQVHFKALREWIIPMVATGHPVRDSAVHMARSAIIHRLLKFGPDETMNNCSAREILALLVFTNGLGAEYLMRVAYIRSIIEGDHEVYEKFNQTLFIPDLRAWYWQIVEALMGKHPNPQEVEAWIAAMQGEELSVARLIIARVYPDLAMVGWLQDIPDNLPRLAAEMCRVILTDPLKTGAIRAYLRDHPEVRYCVGEGTLP